MRRRGSDLVGRWPWGLWLALVGVSGGTVAAFAAVAWLFTSAAGLYDGAVVAEAPEWNDHETVFVETEEATGAEEGPEAERSPEAEATGESHAPPAPDPEPEATRTPHEEQAAPVPELVPVEPSPEPELEPSTEPVPEAGKSDPPRLVPIEELSLLPRLVPLDPGSWGEPDEDRLLDLPDKIAEPSLILEHGYEWLLRPKE